MFNSKRVVKVVNVLYLENTNIIVDSYKSEIKLLKQRDLDSGCFGSWSLHTFYLYYCDKVIKIIRCKTISMKQERTRCMRLWRLGVKTLVSFFKSQASACQPPVQFCWKVVLKAVQ